MDGEPGIPYTVLSALLARAASAEHRGKGWRCVAFTFIGRRSLYSEKQTACFPFLRSAPSTFQLIAPPSPPSVGNTDTGEAALDSVHGHRTLSSCPAFLSPAPFQL